MFIEFVQREQSVMLLFKRVTVYQQNFKKTITKCFDNIEGIETIKSNNFKNKTILS